MVTIRQKAGVRKYQKIEAKKFPKKKKLAPKSTTSTRIPSQRRTP
jgi:hypothetical protein